MENKEVHIKMIKQVLDKIRKETEVPVCRMSLSSKKPTIFESKVGGIVGYLPKGEKIPTDSDGNQLRLLAQINFKDVDLEEFPKEGMLQFWVLNDDVSGLDFDEPTKQDTFRVIYHERIDETVNAEEILAQVVKNDDEEDNYFPVQGESGLVFEKSGDFMTDCDFRFEDTFKKAYIELGFDESEYKDCMKHFYDYLYDNDYNCYDDNDYSTHQIGGYPSFTQSDPRDYKDNGINYNYLLFQLDTDDCREDEGESSAEIMWGDCGIGNFFIDKQKLIERDFSDVLYNWDCC